MRKYLWNILISLDQLFNTILGGFPDETISSRLGKKLAKHENCPICNAICKFLNLFQKNHCIKAIEYDEGEKIDKVDM